MENYLDGFDKKEVTLKATGTVAKGKTVMMIQPFTLNAATDGSIFTGVCTYAKNGVASVQLKGYVRVAYTGEAPGHGYVKLSANGKGGVKADENGRFILVADVDTEAMTCGIIL